MKKVIIVNDENFYEFRYIISKKKCFLYMLNKKSNSRKFYFFKKNISHRHCNAGPQFKDKWTIGYIENGKHHNLYDYAYIDKIKNIKEYWINDINYKKYQFDQYLSIYNTLSYKRIY